MDDTFFVLEQTLIIIFTLLSGRVQACWDLDPSNRPDFSEINTVLEDLFQELS